MTVENVGTPVAMPPLTSDVVIVVVIVYWIFLPNTCAQSVLV